MPELPEVETVARQLNHAVAGRRITRLSLNDPKLRLDTDKVSGCRIAGVRRIGKRIVFELIPAGKRKVALWLCVHLRMTGRLLWQAEQNANSELRKPRAIFELNHGWLLFRDTRRFGTLELHDSFDALLPTGIEPLSPELDCARLTALLADSPTPLKTWLLRQDKLVGIGNIYASEICFAARLVPRRPAGRLQRREVQRLLSAIRRVLRAAIKHCGTTFSDFQDSRGRTGGYVRYLKVYGRKGRPCRACGTAIVKIVQQQRSTFYCPACQSQ